MNESDACSSIAKMLAGMFDIVAWFALLWAVFNLGAAIDGLQAEVREIRAAQIACEHVREESHD